MGPPVGRRHTGRLAQFRALQKCWRPLAWTVISTSGSGNMERAIPPASITSCPLLCPGCGSAVRPLIELAEREKRAERRIPGRCEKIDWPCHSQRSEESAFLCFQAGKCRCFAKFTLSEQTADPSPAERDQRGSEGLSMKAHFYTAS